MGRYRLQWMFAVEKPVGLVLRGLEWLVAAVAAVVVALRGLVLV